MRKIAILPLAGAALVAAAGIAYAGFTLNNGPSLNSGIWIKSKNTTTGTAASAEVSAEVDSGRGGIRALNSGYTASGMKAANELYIFSGGGLTNGIAITPEANAGVTLGWGTAPRLKTLAGSVSILNGGLTLADSGGTGFVDFLNQSSSPLSGGTSHVRFFASIGSRPSYISGSDGFVRTLASTLTANRTYTWQDASGTIAFLDTAQTFSGALTFSNTMTATSVGATGSGDVNLCISTAGVITKGTCGTSTLATKNLVGRWAHGLDYVMQMSPQTFTYKTDPKKVEYVGGIADWMAEIDPRLGTYDADGKLQNISDRAWIATLTVALQDAEKQIQDLQAADAATHKRLDDLMARIALLEQRH